MASANHNSDERNFYVFHATSEAGWANIRATGELRPFLPSSPYPRDRLIYFAYNPRRALEHGSVLLAVRFISLEDIRYLGASEWQVGTPHAIPLDKIELIEFPIQRSTLPTKGEE